MHQFLFLLLLLKLIIFGSATAGASSFSTTMIISIIFGASDNKTPDINKEKENKQKVHKQKANDNTKQSSAYFVDCPDPNIQKQIKNFYLKSHKENKQLHNIKHINNKTINHTTTKQKK